LKNDQSFQREETAVGPILYLLIITRIYRIGRLLGAFSGDLFDTQILWSILAKSAADKAWSGWNGFYPSLPNEPVIVKTAGLFGKKRSQPKIARPRPMP
jgi:hypothetical protein